MVVPELEVYRYANFAHEDTGTSVLTGKAMVASTEEDRKNSAYVIGDQLVAMKKEAVDETYSPEDPSQAQTVSLTCTDACLMLFNTHCVSVYTAYGPPNP